MLNSLKYSTIWCLSQSIDKYYMSKKSLRQLRRIEAKADKEMSYKSWAKGKSVAKQTSAVNMLPKDEIITLEHLTKPNIDK